MKNEYDKPNPNWVPAKYEWRGIRFNHETQKWERVHILAGKKTLEEMDPQPATPIIYKRRG